MSVFINKDEIKSKARGNWLEIFAKIDPTLVESNTRLGVHSPCPKHGGTDGFRFYKDANETGGGVCNTCGNFPDGLSLLQWVTDKSFFDVLKDVSEVLGYGTFKAPPILKRFRKVDPKDEAKAIALKDATIRGHLSSTAVTSQLIGRPAALLGRKYLNSRGLTIIPQNLRYHSALAYLHDDGRTEYFPGILATVVGADGQNVTFHRTYLDPVTGSKADVKFPKKLMRYESTKSLHGSAIRLAPCPGDTLCVTEGIETAIAVMEGTGLPAWATISTVFMETFVPPENVKRVLVFADKDASDAGIVSATKLVQTLWAKGIKASIELPPSAIPLESKGVDWLDELVMHGKAAFPKVA